MIKLKSNQLGYKLFLVLCILGSGIHVHAGNGFSTQSHSKIDTSITPNSVEQADRMLVDAASKGDVGRVEQLVQAGDNPRVTPTAVDRAFMSAADNGHTKIMEQLLDLKDDQRKVTQPAVDNAFRSAALHGREDVMKILLKEAPEGSKVNTYTVWIAFYYAAKGERVESMRLLLKEVPEDLQVTSGDVEKILMSAAEDGRTKTLKYLLSQDRIKIDPQVHQNVFNKLVSKMDLKNLAELSFPKEMYESSKELIAYLDRGKLTQGQLKAIMAIRTEDGKISPFAEYIIDSRHKLKSSINRIFDKYKMNSDVVRVLWEMAEDWDLTDLAGLHFPKEVYENSKELNARLDQLDQISEEELKTIMAIRTEDGQMSPFAEYLIELVLDGKKWGSKKPWFSKQQAIDFMGEQHYQDPMPMLKLRQKGTTKVSKLQKGVFRHMLEYVQPKTADKSNKQGQAKKGGQQNDLGSID